MLMEYAKNFLSIEIFFQLKSGHLKELILCCFSSFATVPPANIVLSILIGIFFLGSGFQLEVKLCKELFVPFPLSEFYPQLIFIEHQYDSFE